MLRTYTHAHTHTHELKTPRYNVWNYFSQWEKKEERKIDNMYIDDKNEVKKIREKRIINVKNTQ